MIIPDINRLIDQRSQKIWDEINVHYDISLKFHDKEYYIAYSINKTVIFYITENNYNKDYFAHEILHIYLYTKQIKIGGYLTIRFQGNALLSDVFSDPLIEHISNTLDHVKMLQLYLDLGFDRAKFLLDYSTPKCTNQEIELISGFINSNDALWKHSADLYLGKYFAIKSCPNNKIDYNPYLNHLKRIDDSLFFILENFWNKWLEFDIEKYDSSEYNYWGICTEFYDLLYEWTLKKQL
jgi:hypothetical protein